MTKQSWTIEEWREMQNAKEWSLLEIEYMKEKMEKDKGFANGAYFYLKHKRELKIRQAFHDRKYGRDSA